MTTLPKIATFAEALRRELEAGASPADAEIQAMRNVMTGQSLAINFMMDQLYRTEALANRIEDLLREHLEIHRTREVGNE